MTVPVVPTPGVDSVDDLRARGFAGFATIAALRESAGAEVPAAPGAWLVVRESAAAVPRFLARSTAAPWRGQDATLSADELAARWVAHACVLYAGTAPGPGVRHLLQQRIKRFLRFGSGRNVAHWPGRRVWQLGGAGSLRIAWKVAPQGGAPAAVREVLRAFEEHHGMIPFANDPGEDEA